MCFTRSFTKTKHSVCIVLAARQVVSQLSSGSVAHELSHVNVHVCWRFFQTCFTEFLIYTNYDFCLFSTAPPPQPSVGRWKSVGVCPSFEVSESQERSLWLWSFTLGEAPICQCLTLRSLTPFEKQTPRESTELVKSTMSLQGHNYFVSV